MKLFIGSHQSARAINIVIATIGIFIFNPEQKTSDNVAKKPWCLLCLHLMQLHLPLFCHSPASTPVGQYANIFHVELSIVNF